MGRTVATAIESLLAVRIRQGFLLCAIASSLVGVTPQTSPAGFLSPAQFITEFLAEAQGEDAEIVQTLFGNDSSSPLHFTSNVDVATTTFSYSLVPGSTYQGLGMNLSGSGVFDSGTNVWTLTSSGALGPTTWDSLGTDSITNLDLTSHSNRHYRRGLEIQRRRDIEDDKDVNSSGVSFGRAWRTFDGVQQGNTWGILDNVPKDRAEWNWSASGDALAALIVTAGVSPTDGGAGTFTTVISSVPEPESLTTFVIGAVILVGHRMLRCAGERHSE